MDYLLFNSPQVVINAVLDGWATRNLRLCFETWLQNLVDARMATWRYWLEMRFQILSLWDGRWRRNSIVMLLPIMTLK